MNTKGCKAQQATEDSQMEKQLTIPNRCHNTTCTPLSNKITATTRGTNLLEGQGKVETNTHLHLPKHSNSTRSHMYIRENDSRYAPTTRNTYISSLRQITGLLLLMSWDLVRQTGFDAGFPNKPVFGCRIWDLGKPVLKPLYSKNL